MSLIYGPSDPPMYYSITSRHAFNSSFSTTGVFMYPLEPNSGRPTAVTGIPAVSHDTEILIDTVTLDQDSNPPFTTRFELHFTICRDNASDVQRMIPFDLTGITPSTLGSYAYVYRVGKSIKLRDISIYERITGFYLYIKLFNSSGNEIVVQTSVVNVPLPKSR